MEFFQKLLLVPWYLWDLIVKQENIRCSLDIWKCNRCTIWLQKTVMKKVKVSRHKAVCASVRATQRSQSHRTLKHKDFYPAQLSLNELEIAWHKEREENRLHFMQPNLVLFILSCLVLSSAVYWLGKCWIHMLCASKWRTEVIWLIF